MTTGQRIQQVRKAANLSQRELGRKLGISGSMIAQYENNLRNPKWETLQRMADVLGVNVDWLRSGTGPEQQSQEKCQSASSSKRSEEIFRLLSFLELPPDKEIVFQNSYAMMQNCIEQICLISEKEPDPQTLQILARSFARLSKDIRQLVPDGYGQMRRKYEERQRREREYEELMNKYRSLTSRNRREAEKYIDYLIFNQEHDPKNRKE